MTTEAMDLLDRLSSPELAQKAEKDANRPFDRFAGKHFRADIPSQDLDIVSRRPAGSNFDQWGIFLTVDVTEVYEGNIEPGEYQLWIRSANPTTRDGKENKRTLNSELVQMVTAAGRAARSWPGNKGVEFTEDTYEYTYDRNTNQKDPLTGKDVWERGVIGVTYFYRLNFSGASTQTNGAKPAAEPTQEAVEKAISLLQVEGGMKIVDFGLACMKDPLIKKDTALISLLASSMDKFLTDQVNAGRVLRNGDVVQAV